MKNEGNKNHALIILNSTKKQQQNKRKKIRTPSKGGAKSVSFR